MDYSDPTGAFGSWGTPNTGARADKLKAHFKSRLKSLQDLRTPMEALWRMVDEAILPLVFNVSQDGEIQNTVTVNKKIFDGETINASITAANSFATAITPRGVPFVNSVPDTGDSRPGREDFAIAAEREAYCKYHESFLMDELGKSNWYEEEVVFFKKMFDYGTSAMYPQEDDDGTTYYCTLPKMSYYIDEGDDGEIDTLWRNIYLQNRHIILMFPNISTKAMDKIKDKPYNKTRVIHIVEPRADFDPSSKLSIDKKFGSYYVMPSCEWEILEESGHDEFPYIVQRQYREPGFVWGFGSGINCIRDAYVLQAIGRTITDYTNRAADPFYFLPKSIQGEEEIFAGGRMFIEPDEAAAIHEGGSGSAYPIGIDFTNRMRDAVNKHYFIQIFQTMNSLRSQNPGVDPTATETDALKAESMSIISAITSSAQSCTLDRVLEDLTERGLKSGRLKPFKPSVQSEGFNVTFDYIGPLAMAQKIFHALSGADRTMQKIVPLIQFVPGIGDKIDGDAYADLVGKANNSLGILKSGKQVAQERQVRAQAIAQQQQAEMMLKTAQVGAEVSAKTGQNGQPQGAPA